MRRKSITSDNCTFALSPQRVYTSFILAIFTFGRSYQPVLSFVVYDFITFGRILIDNWNEMSWKFPLRANGFRWSEGVVKTFSFARKPTDRFACDAIDCWCNRVDFLAEVSFSSLSLAAEANAIRANQNVPAYNSNRSQRFIPNKRFIASETSFVAFSRITVPALKMR